VIDVNPETERRSGHGKARRTERSYILVIVQDGTRGPFTLSGQRRKKLAVDTLHPGDHGLGTQLRDDSAEML